MQLVGYIGTKQVEWYEFEHFPFGQPPAPKLFTINEYPGPDFDVGV